MGFSLFRKRSEGPLPLISWQQQAFPFQASAGHNYDQWFWPYPAQTTQYTYFNAFYGNQLPNFNKFIPIIATAGQQQIQPSWLRQNNKQQQNALQTGAPGSSPLLWGQQPTANYISSLGQLWSGQGNGTKTRKWGR